MNEMEQDILIGCLHTIYEHMLIEEYDVSLRSFEGLIYLTRKMADQGSSHVTLADEGEVIKQVFQLCKGTDLVIYYNNLDHRMQIERNAVVSAVCRHGLELWKSGYLLVKLEFQAGNDLLHYLFTDSDGKSYGGTVHERDNSFDDVLSR